MTLLDAARQALRELEGLNESPHLQDCFHAFDGEIAALRQAIEQAEQQEPVAWGIANTRPTESKPLMMVMLDEPKPSHLVIPLYTTPPQRQPLTDEEINSLDWKQGQPLRAFIRAIERAHGIGGRE